MRGGATGCWAAKACCDSAAGYKGVLHRLLDDGPMGGLTEWWLR